MQFEGEEESGVTEGMLDTLARRRESGRGSGCPRDWRNSAAASGFLIAQSIRSAVRRRDRHGLIWHGLWTSRFLECECRMWSEASITYLADRMLTRSNLQCDRKRNGWVVVPICRSSGSAHSQSHLRARSSFLPLDDRGGPIHVWR